MNESIPKQLRKAAIRIVLVIGGVLVGIWLVIAQPGFRKSDLAESQVNSARMQATVKALSIEFHPRSFNHQENLDQVANYIAKHFEAAGGRTSRQKFPANGSTFENIRCLFGDGEGPLIVVGAHYDSHFDTPGADDNASGVAGLIELAYLFQDQKIAGQVELVAYSLEEPPFFGSKNMGSYHHAQSLQDAGTPPDGVIILEMIGYFSEEANSQTFPSSVFELFYPDIGNFIAVIGKLDQRSFTDHVKQGMKGASPLPVYSINAPRQIPGIDFSDHRNYWEFNYPAVMVTDTAFYRNTAYHTPNDTWDRLDYEKMGYVVQGVFSAVAELLEK